MQLPCSFRAMGVQLACDVRATLSAERRWLWQDGGTLDRAAAGFPAAGRTGAAWSGPGSKPRVPSVPRGRGRRLRHHDGHQLQYGATTLHLQHGAAMGCLLQPAAAMGGHSFYRLTAPYAEHIAVIIWRVTSPLNIRPSAVANLHRAAA